MTAPTSLQGVEINLDIQVLGRDATSQGATGLNGLEFLSLRDAASDIKDDLTQGDPHGDLHEAGIVHLSRQGKDGCSGALFCADIVEPLCTVHNDLGNIRIALHIVKVGRFTPEACNGREGRSGTGLAATAFNGGQKGGFLAADKCACSLFDVKMEADVCPQDVITQEAIVLCLGNRVFESFDGQRIFCTAVDVAFLCSHGIAADGHSLDEAVGISFKDRAVHKGARVAFVSVTDHILDVARGLHS